MVDPAVAPVGYPDEYRPLPTSPTAAAPDPDNTTLSTTDAARHEAGEIAGTAMEAGAQVVQSAKEQVGEVTKEAGRQARDLVDQLRAEASDQAATQQQRVAGGLRSFADELSGMVSHSEQDGPATDLARQAADRLHDVAQWLENRDPGGVLDEVRSFARRRPGAYLALAAGAGLLAGRLTRGLAAQDDGAGRSRDDGRVPAAAGGTPQPSTLGLSPDREVVLTTPVVGIAAEPPFAPDTVPSQRVAPGSVDPTAGGVSSSFTRPIPSAGSAGDIRR